MSEDCRFCQIAAGDRPAYVLSEDERTIAFLDKQPAVTGHSIVIPRTHEEGVLTIDEPTSRAVFETVRQVASALETALEADGFSVFHTTGPLVGTIEHAHVHVVPRFTDDEVSLSLPRNSLESEEAAAVTARVREQL